MKRPPRTIENDLRLLANYSQRMEKVAERITVAEIEGLSDNDVGFLLHFAERLGNTLSSLAHQCRGRIIDEEIPLDGMAPEDVPYSEVRASGAPIGPQVGQVARVVDVVNKLAQS